jgi:hypothetical protein
MDSTRPSSSIEIDDVIAILRSYHLGSLVLVNETFLQNLRFLLQAKGDTFIEPLNQSRSLSEAPFQARAAGTYFNMVRTVVLWWA